VIVRVGVVVSQLQKPRRLLPPSPAHVEVRVHAHCDVERLTTIKGKGGAIS